MPLTPVTPANIIGMACLALSAVVCSANVQAGTDRHSRPPLIIAPVVAGMFLCDKAVTQAGIRSVEQADAYCRKHKLDGASALARLLDRLEPGGPKGAVQVGYTATLELLALYRWTPAGWAIDPGRVETFLRVLRKVPRPVVVYFSANHFDTKGPITDALAQDPRNLMQLRDGKPPALDYFGNRVVPYTLLTAPTIPVNRYRIEALNYVTRQILRLPKVVRERIVAYTLAGELHHMFPDFENGVGAYQDIQVTDYSPASVADFHQWLRAKYQRIELFNQRTGLSYASFDAIAAPSKNLCKDPLRAFGEHYDAFADGTLPIGGWLWDPEQRIGRLDLYVAGQHVGPIPYGLSRLDVYRAEAAITNPNTGFRRDFDYTALRPGRYRAQVVATAGTRRYQLAAVEFVVLSRYQRRVAAIKTAALPPLEDAGRALPAIRAWLDMPKPLQAICYNPLARDWNLYRESQVFTFLNAFHRWALQAGLPADKLYSHQIVPMINSSWNPQLFAASQTLSGDAPWKPGLNMYGGITDSAWMRDLMGRNKISDYGVPEFNPQQWKRAGVHLAAMQSHYAAGARFISPYYFFLFSGHFTGGTESAINRMDLAPNNPNDGSDRFYAAIVEYAKN